MTCSRCGGPTSGLSANEYRRAAKALLQVEDRLEFDTTAMVHAQPGGAYVQAWVWISDDRALAWFAKAPSPTAEVSHDTP